jgi:phage gp36-like protein
MGAYIEQSDVAGLIPADFLTEALDDNGDGAADSGIWDSALAAAQNEVDGRLGGLYTVPFSGTIPAVVKAATQTLSLWLIYKRRGVADAANPWAELAMKWLDKLDKIGSGKEPLVAAVTPKVAGDVIGEDSKLFSEGGNLLV